MGLNKEFPKNPFEKIKPELRWFPGNDALGEKGREKLLPPLVNKIRKEVNEWRKNGYPDITETSRSLMNFWFNTEHPNGFQYYFAQQESVETIIYLYENQKVPLSMFLWSTRCLGQQADQSVRESVLGLDMNLKAKCN